MSDEHVIRAWNSPEDRPGLSGAERSLLPDHPSGFLDLAGLTGAELDQAVGGGMLGGGNNGFTNLVEFDFSNTNGNCHSC